MSFVSPMAVSNANPLARVDDVFNGVLVNANMVGEVMFYGPGAGKLPTASAVVADIVDIIAKRNTEINALGWVNADVNDVADFAEFSCRRMVITTVSTDACVEADGVYAYISDAMTEKQADELKANDSSIVAIYRTLG